VSGRRNIKSVEDLFNPPKPSQQRLSAARRTAERKQRQKEIANQTAAAEKRAKQLEREAQAEAKARAQAEEEERLAEACKFHFTPKQEQALDLLMGPQRHTMLAGGSRSGKTFLLVRSVLVRAIGYDNSRHVIFRLRGNACRTSVWMDTFAKVLRTGFPELDPEIHLLDGYVRLFNGSEIWFAGLDDKERVEKVLGHEFATMYFNECSQIPYSSVETALTRLAQRVPGCKNRAYYDLNPTTTKHWTYQLFVQGLDPKTQMPRTDRHQYKWMLVNPEDNRDNIDEEYLESLRNMPERMQKRFLRGEYLAEVDNALWTPESIESSRVDDTPSDFDRIVVAIDPSGCSGEEDKRSDEIGIAVVGKRGDHGFLIKDATMKGKPEQWARRAVQLYADYRADAIVGETNYGGDMVRATIHNVNPNVRFKKVTATRGKHVRAEPVSALYELNRFHHIGNNFDKLEDEMVNFTTDGYKGDRSPNRTDALVWAAFELFPISSELGLLTFYQNWATELEKPDPLPSTDSQTPASVVPTSPAREQTPPPYGNLQGDKHKSGW